MKIKILKVWMKTWIKAKLEKRKHMITWLLKNKLEKNMVVVVIMMRRTWISG